ncbi:uncharacterized protein LOC124681481 [Lolium rigidum]|uniref:uncharacterized protein LOC124681481 n=1 Tax=Lolium rigidum TaxID=89674 RepID=UPI001F5D27F8|nr:uncharacterized protein LOC124681481 [Lolium rigidum]
MDLSVTVAMTSPSEHGEQLRKRQHSLSELTYVRDEDAKLETTRARLSNLLKRHEDLKERLSRDSDKLIFERLQKEFEAARVAQTEEISIDDEQWNDGLLATIREKVHMEAERKAMVNQTNVPADCQFQSRTTYRIRNKVIYCLDGARIGIQYETFFAGEPCEIYHCVLESKSFLEKMTVIEHTLPFFLPIREVESDHLSSNAIKFIDHLEEILQSYIDRREQVRLIKELYGNQIGELFNSLPYNLIEFVLEDFECKVTVSIRYSDLLFTLPSQARVLAWPLRSYKRISAAGRRSSSGATAQPVPFRLPYAEDALKTLSLPEAYAEIVLNLPGALKKVFYSQESD